MTTLEIDILRHASTNGRYVTADPFVLEMASRGLLYDYGPQALAGGAHYLVTTPAGRRALNDWQAAQPRPKVKRRSPAYEGWRAYCESFKRVTFSHFWKEIWPNYTPEKLAAMKAVLRRIG